MSDAKTTQSVFHRFNRVREPLIVSGVPVVASILFMKYSPMVLLGSMMGLSIYASKIKDGRKQAVFTALCFTSLLYLTLGFPATRPHLWPGALFWLDPFNRFCIFAAKTWNEIPWVQRFTPGQLVSKITIQGIREYVWVSYYVAIGYSCFLVMIERLGILKGRPPALLMSVLSLPARGASIFIGLIFGLWAKAGKYAYGKEGSPIIALTVTLLSGLLGYVGTLSAASVRFLEVKWCFGNFSFTPFVGCISGLILGAPIVSEFVDEVMGKKKKEDHSGFILGNTFEGRPYRLTEKNLGYHVEIVAPTGSGKTNLLKGLIADRIQKGHGVIFLDYKAEFDMISWIYRTAKSVNRENELRLLSLSNRDLSVPYNPIKDGDATDIHSALMNAMTWSEQYYRAIASVALMTVVKALCVYRDKTKEFFHLGHLFELLDQPGLLRAFSDRLRELNLPGVEKLQALASRLDKPAEKEKLTGLMANLDQLLNSSAGELLSQDVVNGSYGVFEAILEGRITVMLMNSLKLKESARVIGKTIVQDLIRYVGDHYAQIEQRKSKPITLIIDEFANCAIPEFIELLDRARGAGIGIVMAHQARADLMEISPAFQSRIEANSNTTLVSGVKDGDDAEYYSGMLGTRTVIKETSQKREGLIGDETTGMKSTREAEEFILHPNVLKTLDQGKVFAVSRIIDPQWGLVKVSKAQEFSEQQVSNSDLIAHLKQIRDSYQHQEGVRYLDLESLKEQVTVAGHEESAAQVSVAEAWN